jgi:hypothetical protein
MPSIEHSVVLRTISPAEDSNAARLNRYVLSFGKYNSLDHEADYCSEASHFDSLIDCTPPPESAVRSTNSIYSLSLVSSADKLKVF